MKTSFNDLIPIPEQIGFMQLKFGNIRKPFELDTSLWDIKLKEQIEFIIKTNRYPSDSEDLKSMMVLDIANTETNQILFQLILFDIDCFNLFTHETTNVIGQSSQGDFEFVTMPQNKKEFVLAYKLLEDLKHLFEDYDKNEIAFLPTIRLDEFEEEVSDLKDFSITDLPEYKKHLKLLYGGKIPIRPKKVKGELILNLSEKKLKTIPEEVFGFEDLTVLDLSWNKLTVLPSEIGNLKRLKVLNLKGNNFKNLPPEFCQLTNLEVFNIDGKIKSFPEDVKNLTALKEIDLSGYSNIPKGIGSIPNIEKISLLANKGLEELPDEIYNLKEVKFLNLNYCAVKSISPLIGNWEKLEDFYFGECKFEELPAEFWKLNNLKHIHGYHSKLSVIPKEISNFKLLETLGLVGCNIEHLPREICELNLKGININNNPIKNIAKNKLYEVCRGGFSAIQAYFKENP